MKSAKLEWSLNDLSASLQLLDEALKVFPDYAKLWMMTGQIYEQRRDVSKAFDAYNAGVIIICTCKANFIVRGWFEKSLVKCEALNFLGKIIFIHQCSLFFQLHPTLLQFIDPLQKVGLI